VIFPATVGFAFEVKAQVAGCAKPGVPINTNAINATEQIKLRVLIVFLMLEYILIIFKC